MKTKNKLKKEWHEQCREKTLFCWLCGQLILREADISVDHVIPRAKGGTNAETNLQPAHSLCNSIRGTRDPEVFRQILQKDYNGSIHAWWKVLHLQHLEKIRQ